MTRPVINLHQLRELAGPNSCDVCGRREATEAEWNDDTIPAGGRPDLCWGECLSSPPDAVPVARDALLALVEAVEAAHAVVERPFGQINPRAFYRLREKLSGFDFSGAAAGGPDA